MADETTAEKLLLELGIKDSTSAGVDKIRQSTAGATSSLLAIQKAVVQTERELRKLGKTEEDVARALDDARAASERTGISLDVVLQRTRRLAGKEAGAALEEYAGGLGTVAEAQDRASSSGLGLVGALTAAGIGVEAGAELLKGFGGAVWEYGVGALRAWQSQSEQATAVTAVLDGALDNLTVSIGRNIDATGRVTASQAGLARATQEASDILDQASQNQETLATRLGLSERAHRGMETAVLSAIPGVGLLTQGYRNATDILADYGQESVASIDATEGLTATVDRQALAFGALDAVLSDVNERLAEQAQRLADIEDAWNTPLQIDPVAAIGEAGRGAAAPRPAAARAPNAFDPLRDRAAAASEGWLREAAAEREGAERILKSRETLAAQLLKLEEDFQRNLRKLRDDSDSSSSGLTDAQQEFVRASESAADRLKAGFDAASDGAVNLGIEIGALAAEVLAAGDGFEAFGARALGMFGDFASGAGRALLLAGLGELAIFSGNPAGAIAAGTALIALGAVLSGVGRSTLGGGAGAAPRASTPSAASAEARLERAQARLSRGDAEREGRNRAVYVFVGRREIRGVVVGEVEDARRRGHAV